MAVLKVSEVEPKIREMNGNLAAAARFFGVTRQAMWLFVQERPTLKAACHDARESMKDHAESALHRALLAGEAWAVCFYLKCQAKDRGYIEKAEEKKPDTASTQAATDAQIASALAGAIGRIGKLPPDVAGGPPAT